MKSEFKIFVINSRIRIQKLILLEDIQDKKYGQKIDFFANARNAKYINWKSIPILRYYLTRFGDIKPRLYTGNSVKTQKKVRQEIIRARTLGLLSFISR